MGHPSKGSVGTHCGWLEQKGVYHGVLVTVPDHQDLLEFPGMTQSHVADLGHPGRATSHGSLCLQNPRELTGLAELTSQQGLHCWAFLVAQTVICLQRGR